MFQFHKVRLKDKNLGVAIFAPILFQFHKVRLKDAPVFACIWENIVSIPQGTIKSTASAFHNVAFISFQFHKVRLKVSAKA